MPTAAVSDIARLIAKKGMARYQSHGKKIEGAIFFDAAINDFKLTLETGPHRVSEQESRQ